MTENVHNDWDLRSEEVQKDQVAAYDAMRRRCPVAHDEFMGYSVFKNADVQHVLDHPEIYSNVVSTRHIAVPNGMDAPNTPPSAPSTTSTSPPNASKSSHPSSAKPCRASSRTFLAAKR